MKREFFADSKKNNGKDGWSINDASIFVKGASDGRGDIVVVYSIINRVSFIDDRTVCLDINAYPSRRVISLTCYTPELANRLNSIIRKNLGPEYEKKEEYLIQSEKNSRIISWITKAAITLVILGLFILFLGLECGWFGTKYSGDSNKGSYDRNSGGQKCCYFYPDGSVCDNYAVPGKIYCRKHLD